MLTGTWRPKRAGLHARAAAFPSSFVVGGFLERLFVQTRVSPGARFSPPAEMPSSASRHLAAEVNAEGSSDKTEQGKDGQFEPAAPAPCCSLGAFSVASLHQSGKYVKKKSETESVRSSDRGPTGVEMSHRPDTAPSTTLVLLVPFDF